MSDLNVNFKDTVSKLAEFLKSSSKDTKELTGNELKSIFAETSSDTKSDNIDLYTFATDLIENFTGEEAPSLSVDYYEMIKEIAVIDGDANSFTQKDIDLIAEILDENTSGSTEGVNGNQNSNETENATKEEPKDDTVVTLSDEEIRSMADKLRDATIRFNNCDYEAIAEVLKNENLTSADIVAIIDASGSHSLLVDPFLDDELREIIVNAQQKMKEKELKEEAQVTLSDKEISLMAKKLHNAMKDWGTDEEAVYDILENEDLTSADIVAISKFYEAKYGKSLEKDIKEDFTGDEEKSLIKILDKAEKNVKSYTINNGNTTLSDNEVELYVENLREAMEGWGTDEEAVYELLGDPSLTPADILKIMDEFEDKYGETLEHDIRGDFTGDAQKALLEILRNAENGISPTQNPSDPQNPSDSQTPSGPVIDTNGDGKVTHNELLNYLATKEGGHSLDKNNDQLVSFDEYSSDKSYESSIVHITEEEAIAYERSGLTVNYTFEGGYTVDSKTKIQYEYQNDDISSYFDKNNDGVITDEEINANLDNFNSAIEANRATNSGQNSSGVTEPSENSEGESGQNQETQAAPIFFDKNYDGNITEKEILDYLASKPEGYSLDKDMDKEVSFKEYSADKAFQTVMVEITEKEAIAYENAGLKVNWDPQNGYTVDSKVKIEYEYSHKDVSTKYDTNNDGVISEEEINENLNN